jgi:hypothetical protein
MKGAAAAGKPRQQQATRNHPRQQVPSHRNFLNHQVSTFNFLDFPNGLVVFQRDGIIGEARLQSQAALRLNFIHSGRHRPKTFVFAKTPLRLTLFTA